MQRNIQYEAHQIQHTLHSCADKMIHWGAQIFKKSSKTTSKFLAPAEWHETTSILRTHKY